MTPHRPSALAALCLALVAWVAASCAPSSGADVPGTDPDLHLVGLGDAEAAGRTAAPDVAPEVEPQCAWEHVVDGRFTGWPECETEWPNPPLQGVFGRFYFDIDIASQRLHVLNDWLLNEEGPVPDGWYNLFFLDFGECFGAQFEVRVYGNQTIRVWQKGAAPPRSAAGLRLTQYRRGLDELRRVV